MYVENVNKISLISYAILQQLIIVSRVFHLHYLLLLLFSIGFLFWINEFEIL